MRGLLRLHGINRVYVLGAGFSAPIGMPLTGELLKEAHTIAGTKPWYGDGGAPSPNGQADWLLEQLQWYFPLDNFSHEAIHNSAFPRGFDVEKFLSYVASTSAFKFKTGERWNEHGDKFTAFLKSWLAEAIVRRQTAALADVPAAYMRFAKSLKGALVLTFNWDTVLESLLQRHGLGFAFDLHSAYGNGLIPVIKLHGSIDWFSKPDKAEMKDWMQFDPLSDNFDGCLRAQGNLLAYYAHHLTPWIVTPSYDKTSQILSLGDIWQLPWNFLQDELEVIVIGFSMRPDDFHSRAFLYPQLVHGTRKGYLRVKVVDLAEDETQRSQVIQRFSGVEGCQFFFSGFSNDALDFIETT